MESEALTNRENRRISPNGMIDLPFTTRKALGFEKGKSKLLTIKVEGDSVRIAPADKAGPDTVEASPLGLLRLPKEAHQALAQGKKGRYALAPETKGAKQDCVLRPGKK